MWRKSSYSGPESNCVEVAWHKSSHSGPQANCVEVASGDTAVGLRDSKNPHAGHLTVPHAAFDRLIEHLKRG